MMNQDELLNTISNSMDFIIIRDLAGTVIYTNDVVTDKLGDISGKNISEIDINVYPSSIENSDKLVLSGEIVRYTDFFQVKQKRYLIAIKKTPYVLNGEIKGIVSTGNIISTRIGESLYAVKAYINFWHNLIHLLTVRELTIVVEYSAQWHMGICARKIVSRNLHMSENALNNAISRITKKLDIPISDIVLKVLNG